MGNALETPAFNDSGNQNQWVLNENRAWMSRIPDDRRLADISIPGTHNSCAEEAHGGFVNMARCQSKCLIHQLRLGIRFLDIRCNQFTEGPHMLTQFGIYHGIVYQHLSFGDVLRTIETFFHEQPREAIMMRIRTAEHPNMPTPDHLAQSIFNLYRHQHPNLFYDGNINAGGTTLGQVRGRIVVLQHIQLGNFTGWNECYVEDMFEAVDIEKEASITQGFNHFAAAANNHITITFGSGCYSPIPNPNAYAREHNPFTYNLVREFRGQGRGVGIVAVDFPGDELIRDIINLNFIFFIVNPASNMVLDCQNGVQGTAVILWTRHGGVNQRWIISSEGWIANGIHNRVLDCSGGGTDDGTNIILWEWHGGPNQIFRVDRERRLLLNPNSGKVVDCRNGYNLGTVLGHLTAANTQQWNLVWTCR